MTIAEESPAKRRKISRDSFMDIIRGSGSGTGTLDDDASSVMSAGIASMGGDIASMGGDSTIEMMREVLMILSF